MSEALVARLFGPPTKLPDETTTTFAVRLVQRDAASRALASPSLDVERLTRAIMRANIFGPEGIPPTRWDLYAGTVAKAIAKAYAEERP